jgi:hypothetical protein
MSTVDINNTVKQYLGLKEQIDLLVERQSELKKRLTEAVESYGEVDGKGHIVFDAESATLVKQRKVSKPLDMETAMQILEEKELVEECTTLVRQIDQDAIMAAFYKDSLTEAEIDSMFPEKISYAFLVKPVNA